jgi:hypothetical protein
MASAHDGHAERIGDLTMDAHALPDLERLISVEQ